MVDSHPPVVLSVLPAFSVNPAYGVLFGVATTALLRLGPPPATSASTAGVTVSYTTKQQFNVVARANIFGPSNEFLFQGDWRYLDTSQPTYGLGPAQPEELEDNLEFRLIRLYQTLFRPVSGQVLAGIGYHLNDYYDIVDPKAEQGLPSPMVDYNDGRIVTRMFSSGLSLNMVFDSRDSPIYATRGYYVTGSFRTFPTWLGSDTEWQSFQADFRTYTAVGRRSSVRRVGDHLVHLRHAAVPRAPRDRLGHLPAERQGLPPGPSARREPDLPGGGVPRDACRPTGSGAPPGSSTCCPPAIPRRAPSRR